MGSEVVESISLICIDDTKDGVKIGGLTKGKSYKGFYRKLSFKVFYVINDSGTLATYNGKLFITLEESRNNKLKDLGL